MDADDDEARDVVPDATQTGRNESPRPAGLRQRPPFGRSSISTDHGPRFKRRSSSFMSETLSESRRSFQASTDDLIRPRVKVELDDAAESSHWHSLPLGLAIVPAVGGLFFQNGSAFLTDIIVLALGALFLNWAVRLPWDWYHSAQALVVETESPIPGTPVEAREGATSPTEVDGVADENSKGNTNKQFEANALDEQARKARHELRVHEALALAACFVSPLLASWLLHAIRSQLSRPSEGLVSDFNITIFLLGAEVRPLRHLIKLVQRRTIFLQRRISASALKSKDEQQDARADDLARRIEDLEAHVSDHILQNSNTQAENTTLSQEAAAKATTQAVTDLRRSIQPELDALNRAMRRYEKRSTISAVQTEARLQDLESRVNDVVVLAAAAHRSADTYFGKYSRVLLNWMSAIVVVPLEYLGLIVTFPTRLLASTIGFVQKKFGIGIKDKEKQTSPRSSAARQRSREKKGKATS